MIKLMFLILILFSTITQAAQVEWKYILSPSGLFSISLPCQPEINIETLTDLKTIRKYSCDSNYAFYIINETIPTEKGRKFLKKPTPMLDEMEKELPKAFTKDGIQIVTKRSMQGAYEVLTVESKPGKKIVRILVYAGSGSLVQIIISGAADNDKDIEKVIQSFKMLK